MKTAKLDKFYELHLDGEEVFLLFAGKVQSHMDWELAKKFADQIMLWDIDSVYNAKDEDGNPVADEVVESARD